MTPYVKPLALLFIGGMMVGISAVLREISPLWSSILFFTGYTIDAVGVALGVKIWWERRS